MVFYNRGKRLFLEPENVTGESPFTLTSDIIRVALMLTTYSINIDTHQQFDDIATSEIANSSVTNYTARGNGIQLAAKAFATDDSNDRAEFDANDLTYTAIGNGTNATFDQIVIMREQDASATNANTELIAHTTVASTLTNGGDVTLQWDAQGILQITA